MTKKKKYAKSVSGEIGLDHVPFVGMFAENPLGSLVAAFLLMLIISYFASGLPTNPFNGYSDWTSLWTLLGNQFNWLVLAAVPFFFVGVIFEALHGREEEELTGIPTPTSRARLRISEARMRIQMARHKPVTGGALGSSSPENIN